MEEDPVPIQAVLPAALAWLLHAPHMARIDRHYHMTNRHYEIAYTAEPNTWGAQSKRTKIKGFWKRNMKRLKKERTEAERTIYPYLCHPTQAVLGLRWRFQRPFCERFPDFRQPHTKLILEADGGHHDLQLEQDLARDIPFARLGYIVLRVPNFIITEHLGSVLAEVERLMLERLTIQSKSRPRKPTCLGAIYRYKSVPPGEPRFIGDGSPLHAFKSKDLPKPRLRTSGQA